MPFTIAHTAVSLPFIRRMRAFSIFGLVIGSMAPDFEYFIRLEPASLGGHTPIGFFLLNLPICIVVAILYMNLLEDGLLQLLPEFYARKWPRFGRNIKTYAVAEWLNFIFWTLAGMIGHLFMDSFTHSGGYFVTHVPILKSTVSWASISVPMYKILQHGSSIIGILAVFIYMTLRKSRKRMPKPCCNKLYLRSAFFLGVVVLQVVRCILIGKAAFAPGGLIVSTMSFSVLSWLVLSIILKRRDRQAVQEFLPS